jgi:trigger factor
MQIIETTREGLKRELKVTVPKEDMSSRLASRLEQLKGQVRLNGFRQGKVPVAHLRKVYGRQAMAEIVNDLINKETGQILVGRGERAAQRPEIAMTEDENEAQEILAGKQDFEFTVAYEVLPEIEIPDLAAIEIERPLATVTDADVEERSLQIAESARQYEEKQGAAADKDRVTVDYSGSIDGTPFDGGSDTGAQLVLGSKRFIPGFEEQLIGAKAGDRRTIEVEFPADYAAANLAGKKASFDVTVHKVEQPGKLELTDEVAKQLGVESAAKLRETVRTQLENSFGLFTRARVKRQVLDKLDELTRMELPEKMVAAEFENIWKQVTGELERSGKTFADEETTEEKARDEYRKLAERRVRLGLLLAQIGEKAQIQITEEELQRAIYDQVRQYPGQEQQVFDYFRKHPDAVAGLRAPIYEDKVVDHIVVTAKVTDKPVSKEELMKEPEE